MTTVRIASVEHHRRRIHQTQSPSHLVVLIDDAGGRELPIWSGSTRGIPSQAR